MRHSLRLHIFALLVMAAFLPAATQKTTAQTREEFELHLVLAFDVSASINDSEFALQRNGTANALRHSSVRNAISEARGGIAISIVQWSSIQQQVLAMDWVALKNDDDVIKFADAVGNMPRILPGGGTMVHAGLEFSERQFDAAPGVARRHVIDLSGNGRSDDFEQMLATRERLVGRGIVINGLAIEEDYDDLSDYFSASLIGGAGAFVVTANGHEDFGDAMQIKLFREINGAVYAKLFPQ
ncbi:DUF1194 domain-containing protein [uncultured Roseovarius sp.]|uniref:DUF1194 domain-containing protein n=1 Tax=uncultured Roseovarius sp. TaxID=293344 RepID=UPI0026340A31|nr:DUF1194 domain-containing protein [uncultured Roseovarius sp.]